MSKLTDFLADKHNKFHHVWEVESLLPAHDAEIHERAKAELFDQLYAAAGTEAMDAYRAAHPGPLTVLDVVKAIREQAKREQMEADAKEACLMGCEPGSGHQTVVPGIGCIPSPGERIRAAWAEAHPEVKP